VQVFSFRSSLMVSSLNENGPHKATRCLLAERPHQML
jgi:hypothetical protein